MSRTCLCVPPIKFALPFPHSDLAQQRLSLHVMNYQVSKIADSVETIEDDYECIGIRDTSMPDEDVAVAF